MDLKKTAVVMIEFQNDFVKSGGSQHDAVRGVMESTGMLSNSLGLAKEARDLRATIMLTPLTFAEGYPEIVKTPYGILKGIVDAGAFRKSTWGAEIIGEVKPMPENIVIEGKRGLDYLASINPDLILRDRQVQNIVFFVAYRHGHVHSEGPDGGGHLGASARQDNLDVGRQQPALLEGGSWGASSTGAAVQLARLAVAKELLEAAQEIEGKLSAGVGSVDRLEFADGEMIRRDDPTKCVSLVDAVRASGLNAVEAEEMATVGAAGMASEHEKSRNVHSAVLAEVHVDTDPDQVRLTRVVIAVAAGKVINPKTARSQILGGVVKGISMALFEETIANTTLGKGVNHSFGQYHVPAHANIQNIEVIFIDEPDLEVSPLGIEGLGEIGIVSAAAAVADAIYHATGKRVRSLPITVNKLMAA